MMDLPTAIKWYNFPEIKYYIEQYGKHALIQDMVVLHNARK